MTDSQNAQESHLTTVTHDAEHDRYIVEVGGALAGYAEYEESIFDGQKIRDFNHTVIDPDFRGRGLSKPLIKGALDDTVAEGGVRIRATCSAVKGYIEKNPGFEEHVL